MEHLDISSIYADNVFNDESMRRYLPSNIYKQLRDTIDQNKPLDPAIADSVANGMRLWALEKGATHYTHWFQPLTGVTAEKHESFLNPMSDGSVIMAFSGKELIRGESDASSFPSGGLRATFEARGYTMWDCTSPAFVKDNTLYIPTCFCSFNGEILDHKTPLLRSMEALSNQAVRLLHLLGKPEVERVVAMAGAEQEYFLVDKELFDQRLDLMLCNRTLFGARPPKGQEMDGHYYGNIKERVMDFMRELDEELWRLGVPAKTEHNEAAPAQHELAAVYTIANIACDNNQLIMETMKKVALRKGLVCLLHEKPFEGVNGSGKHNNWSLNIYNGPSLLDPGKTPADNAQFLLFLCAVIWAVDEYAELLRASVTSPGNDHRLGGHEAPPPIISVFLGDDLTDILEEIETGRPSQLRQGGNIEIGVNAIPWLPRDTSDRNRTSPFAFTGKKFEFRMLGSSMSIGTCNNALNAAVAEILCRIADRLEKAEDRQACVRELIREIYRDHKRVVFNGNNYSREWVAEAKERGLPCADNDVDAAAGLVCTKSIDLYEKHGIFRRKELEARYNIRLETYVRTLDLEARTMLDMAKRQIIPAVIGYTKYLADCVCAVQSTGLTVDMSIESSALKDVAAAGAQLKTAVSKLEKALEKAATIEDVPERARAYRDKVGTAMAALREVSDRLEMLVSKEYWPIPTYSDLLFQV